jgi:eukaryotic-like serine/threonine-protein kinase
VSTQLIEVPAGTLVWSHTAQGTLRDLFELQDDLVGRIVGSLALPLTAREHRLLKHDVPASPTAYEFYLKGIQVSSQVGLASPEPLGIARDLYLRSIEEDPRYAPAWARLGRCYRVIGKGGELADQNLARAESCFMRALELNPELPIAHTLYAQLEADLGRSTDALIRLVSRARINGSDPDVFAGLVHACRYCGLLDASVAAHEHARRLDPQVATSVRHTFWLLGDDTQALQRGGRFYFEAMVLASIGRAGEAIAVLRECEQGNRPAISRDFLFSLRALLEGNRQASLEATERCIAHFRDPEALFYLARQLAHLGESQRAFAELERAVDQGYLCARALARDPWLEPVRSTVEFGFLLQRASELGRKAARVFVESGGERLLGVGVAR